MAKQVECMARSLFPEVVVLSYVVVGSGSVADYTDACERYMTHVAYVGYGSRFHIYSIDLGIERADMFKHFYIRYEHIT